MTAWLLALWLALDVQGTLTCPTPAEVSQHLAGLLPERGSTEAPSRAHLSAGEGFVHIALVGPDGGLLAERRLDRSGPCGEMAEAVAVILAAWQAQYSPTLVPGAIEPAAPAAVASPALEVVPTRPWLFDAGLGVLTSMVGTQAALGAKLTGVLTPLAHGLGFSWASSASTKHSQAIADPSGQAEWIRPALALGPNLRLQGDRLALDVHGDAVLAILHVKGVGLASTASDTSAQLGLAAGVRGLWTWARGAIWVGTDLLGFPGQDNLTIGNRGQVGRLPHLEIQVSLGGSLGRFR